MVLGVLQHMKMMTMLSNTKYMLTSFHSFLWDPNGFDFSLFNSDMILRLIVDKAIKGMKTVKNILQQVTQNLMQLLSVLRSVNLMVGISSNLVKLNRSKSSSGIIRIELSSFNHSISASKNFGKFTAILRSVTGMMQYQAFLFCGGK